MPAVWKMNLLNFADLRQFCIDTYKILKKSTDIVATAYLQSVFSMIAIFVSWSDLSTETTPHHRVFCNIKNDCQ